MQPFEKSTSCTAKLCALHCKALQAACCEIQGTERGIGFHSKGPGLLLEPSAACLPAGHPHISSIILTTMPGLRRPTRNTTQLTAFLLTNLQSSSTTSTPLNGEHPSGVSTRTCRCDGPTLQLTPDLHPTLLLLLAPSNEVNLQGTLSRELPGYPHTDDACRDAHPLLHSRVHTARGAVQVCGRRLRCRWLRGKSGLRWLSLFHGSEVCCSAWPWRCRPREEACWQRCSLEQGAGTHGDGVQNSRPACAHVGGQHARPGRPCTAQRSPSRACIVPGPAG